MDPSANTDRTLVMSTRTTTITNTRNTVLHPGTAVALWALLWSGEAEARSDSNTGATAETINPKETHHAPFQHLVQV
jgi:hypothetical protein